VTIPEEIWARGPRAVNAEIARLISQERDTERAIFEYGTAPNWDFFLSYSKEDEAFARWIKALLNQAGFSVFAQFNNMPPGSNFVREMQRGLSESSRLVALLSPAYVKSDHCQAEWAVAYNDDPSGERRKLVPFLIRPTTLPPLAQQIIYRPLVGLSPADVAAAVLESVGYGGDLVDTPRGWPASAAVEQMRAAAGGAYEVAPGVDLLLERQPAEIGETGDAGFTPGELFADFAREVGELATHVNADKRNMHCSDRLKERVAKLHQSVATNLALCDVLAINKRLVWVLRALADDKSDGVIPPNDLLEHYASDLYGYYKRLEFIFPKLKPFREMDARHRFTLPSEEEERAICEVYKIFGDPVFAKGALSADLSEEMKEAGKSIEEAKGDAARRPLGKTSDVTIESHTDSATRSLAIWSWLSNAREKFVRSGKSVEEFEKAIESYERLYDRTSPSMIKYIGYLLKWFF